MRSNHHRHSIEEDKRSMECSNRLNFEAQMMTNDMTRHSAPSRVRLAGGAKSIAAKPAENVYNLQNSYHSNRRKPRLDTNNTKTQIKHNRNSHLKGICKRRRQINLISKNMLLTSGLIIALAGLIQVSQAFMMSSKQYFEVEPEAQYLVSNGNDVRFRCLVRNRQGECAWVRNGRTVGHVKKKYEFLRQPEDGDCSLTIKNASVAQDDGQWQCQIMTSDSDPDGLSSREIKLVVLVPPERPQIKNMSQGTQKLALEENKIKSVVCEIRGGNPAPQIEWFLDEKSISKEATTQSALNNGQRITQSKLKLSDIKRAMNGKNLTCVGVHQTLNQSNWVELDVQYVPSVSVVQREYSIVEGSPLSINCQVDANPAPDLVSWRLVSDGGSARSQQQSNGAANSPTRPGPVLEFERISRDHNQNIFECLAKNSYGISLPADVKLNVLYAPFLLNTSHSESVVVGSSAELACVFDGNPEPEIKWHYTDPLGKSPVAIQLDGHKQQVLNIKNVTYRNEGDYHCEARNQINGVYYAVRSSNIILDVYGEPQFLQKSPVFTKAVQGTKSDLALTFCSDPTPSKVYWQFGSLRLDVRLNSNGAGPQAPPVSSKQNLAMMQRFQVHPLQSLQKRDSTFSKVPTCFEAQLTILDPDLTDQRDYTLNVQNERGVQSALVRLRVSSPLSPVLMITSAFVTICGLFLCSLLFMFIFKRRHQLVSANSNLANSQAAHLNGVRKNGVEHLANGNGNTALQTNGHSHITGKNSPEGQQTKNGIVNGMGNGASNEAGNPMSGLEVDQLHNRQLTSMASSDSSSNDQKQLINSHHLLQDNHQVGQFNVNSPNISPINSITSCSSPSIAMNHISVDEDLQMGNTSTSGSTYRAAESVTHGAHLSPAPTAHHLNPNGALIYANLDYTDNNNHTSLSSDNTPNGSLMRSDNTPVVHRRQQLPQQATPSSIQALDPSTIQSSPNKNMYRSNVGATIAMMNNLAAAAAAVNSPNNSNPAMGALNGAINQQLANGGGARQTARKPGPPKPPKPSIQQRNRFLSQQQNGSSNNNNNLVKMVGEQNLGFQPGEPSTNPDGEDLVVEYSRIAFPARAEL